MSAPSGTASPALDDEARRWFVDVRWGLQPHPPSSSLQAPQDLAHATPRQQRLCDPAGVRVVLTWVGLVLGRKSVHPDGVPLPIQHITDEAVDLTGVATLHPCTVCRSGLGARFAEGEDGEP